MADKSDNSGVNLPVVALVALVAIVGLVALVINAVRMPSLATGNKVVSAQSSGISSNGCQVDSDCNTGFVCIESICKQNINGKAWPSKWAGAKWR